MNFYWNPWESIGNTTTKFYKSLIRIQLKGEYSFEGHFFRNFHSPLTELSKQKRLLGVSKGKVNEKFKPFELHFPTKALISEKKSSFTLKSIPATFNCIGTHQIAPLSLTLKSIFISATTSSRAISFFRPCSKALKIQFSLLLLPARIFPSSRESHRTIIRRWEKVFLKYNDSWSAPFPLQRSCQIVLSCSWLRLFFCRRQRRSMKCQLALYHTHTPFSPFFRIRISSPILEASSLAIKFLFTTTQLRQKRQKERIVNFFLCA